MKIEHDLIWQNLPYPIIILNGQKIIQSINSAAESFLGQSMSGLIDKNWSDVFHKATSLNKTIEQCIQKQSNADAYEISFELSGANDMPINSTIDASINIANSNMCILTLFPPRGKTSGAMPASKSISNMAGMLAHEIRNPLTGIKGAAQLIEIDAEPAAQQLAQLIQTETKRIGDLIDEFEVLAESPPLVSEEINIHTILDHTRQAALAGFAHGRQINVLYDPSLPSAAGNPDKLVQVFMNLIKNAIEADPDSEVTLQTKYRSGVRLSSSEQPLNLQIDIKDNGPGIPKDIRDQIFAPFITTKSSGSGLGLPLAAKIIFEHGGILECTSSPNNTVMTVLLPLYGKT